MWLLVISLSVSVVEFNSQMPYEGQIKVLSNQTVTQTTSSLIQREKIAEMIKRNFILANGEATTLEAERYTAFNFSRPTKIFTGTSFECLSTK